MQSNKSWLPEDMELADESLVVDGFDSCIVGVTSEQKVVYEEGLMIALLVARDGMTWDEAKEFFDYNIGGAYVGEFTPIFMTTIRKENV